MIAIKRKSSIVQLGNVVKNSFSIRKKFNGTFLRINDSNEFKNAKVFFEDSCIIMHDDNHKRKVFTIFQWDEVRSMQFE